MKAHLQCTFLHVVSIVFCRGSVVLFVLMATFGQHLFAVSHSFRTALSTSPDHQQRLSKPLVKQGRAVSQRGYSVAQRTTMQFSGLALRFARPDVKCDVISVSKLRLRNSYGDNSCQFVNLGHLSSRVWSFQAVLPLEHLGTFPSCQG